MRTNDARHGSEDHNFLIQCHAGMLQLTVVPEDSVFFPEAAGKVFLPQNKFYILFPQLM